MGSRVGRSGPLDGECGCGLGPVGSIRLDGTVACTVRPAIPLREEKRNGKAARTCAVDPFGHCRVGPAEMNPDWRAHGTERVRNASLTFCGLPTKFFPCMTCLGYSSACLDSMQQQMGSHFSLLQSSNNIQTCKCALTPFGCWSRNFLPFYFFLRKCQILFSKAE